MREASEMRVTKRRKISNELLEMGLKGELLDIVERNLNYQRASELKIRLNNRRTERERERIMYWVEEEVKEDGSDTHV